MIVCFNYATIGQSVSEVSDVESRAQRSHRWWAHDFQKGMTARGAPVVRAIMAASKNSCPECEVFQACMKLCLSIGQFSILCILFGWNES